MLRFLLRWVVVSLSIGVAAYLLPGVEVDSPTALAISGLVLGLINAVVRPVAVMLTIPITVITLGLFLLVINGAAFALASLIVPGFTVTSFGQAIVGSLIVSVISWLFVDRHDD